MAPSKINLSSIMSNNKDKKAKIDSKNISKVSSDIEKIEKAKIDSKNISKVSSDIEKIEKTKIDNKTEIFLNYKSDFIKKEKKIIETIISNKEKLKIKLREPKTRFILMGGLISLTLIIISGLFLINPEKYSLNNYKTSILNNMNNIKKSYIDKPWIDSVINIGDYDFNIAIQEKRNNNKNYKYNNIIYTTKDELYVVLNKEIEISNEKLKKEEEKKLKQEKIRLKEQKEQNQKTIIKNTLLEKFK